MERRRNKLASSAAMPTPVLALLLAACGGGGGGGGGFQEPTVSGFVYDGPVSGAIVYIDVDGIEGYSEAGGDVLVATTTSNGSYSGDIGDIPEEHLGKALFVDLTGATDQGIDPNSTADDRSTSGVWRAPVGSTIISPLTELMVETGLSATQIASRLNLPSNVDITTHNPFDGTNRTKDDVLVIAAGVAVAEELKANTPVYSNILRDVGESVGVLSRAYDVVESSSSVSQTDFNALRNALTTVYGTGLTNRADTNIANELTLGILNHLSQAVAAQAQISATLASSSASIGEIAGNTAKLVDIDVTKPDIFGLELRFVITGNGSEIFEVRGSDEDWGLYVKDNATLDFETETTHTLEIELQVLDGEREVRSEPVVYSQSVSTFTLTVTDEDEPNASIHLDHRGRGDEVDLRVGDVLTAELTPDGDAINASYPIVWMRYGGTVLQTVNRYTTLTEDGIEKRIYTYTLTADDIEKRIFATTTYTDFGNEEVTVTSLNDILPGIQTYVNFTDARIAITHNGASVETLAAGNVLTATVTRDTRDTAQESWEYTVGWARLGADEELARDVVMPSESPTTTYTLLPTDIGGVIYAIVTYMDPSDSTNEEFYSDTRITPGPIAQEQAVSSFAALPATLEEPDSNSDDATTLPDII